MNPGQSKFNFTLALSITLALIVSTFGFAPQRRSTATSPQRGLGMEQTSNDKRYALVIGNGAYTNAPALRNPPNDARDMAAALQNIGFEIVNAGNLTNLTQRQMKLFIREFGQKLRSGGVGLFFYAGHGVQAKGHNYLIPVEAEIESEAELSDVAVDVDLILNYMEDAGNGLNIIILDACRNNPFGRSFRSASNGLAAVEAPTGTLIAYATGPNRVASDGNGRNGLYTGELLRELREEPNLEFGALLRRVGGRVSQATGRKQEPWVSSNVYNDFYFVPPKGGGETANLAKENRPAQVETIDPAAVEQDYWERIKESRDAEDFKEYLKDYPSGRYAATARLMVRQLTTKNAPSTTGGNTTGAKTTLPARPRTIQNRYGIELVLIPPGSFMMGSSESEVRANFENLQRYVKDLTYKGFARESPKHRVTISYSFYMGRTEVTQGQWRAVMGTTVRDQRDKVSKNSRLVGEGDDYPMYYVSWEEAKEFILRLNTLNDGYEYRLPSEAEWEYACRAGTTGDYAGDLDAMAWYGDNSGRNRLNALEIWGSERPNYFKRILDNGGQTHMVGTKQANAFGLYDMQGNVSEWCEDVFHSNYEGAPTDGSAWVSGGEQQSRVLRGGSWNQISYALRSANPGGWLLPGDRHNNLGFRVVAVPRT